MIIYFYISIFLLGLCVGSFLNTVIYRLETKESVLISRSHCLHCRHQLGFFDLIPVLSFIFLGGKCRYCGKKISWQYPLVELATGILFALFFLKIFNFSAYGGSTEGGQFPISNILSLALQLFFVSILIVISVYDLKHYLIPDKIVWAGIIIAVIAYLIFRFTHYSLFTIHYSLLAAAVAGGFFLLLILISREQWMGWGDVKLGILMGLILGWPNILVALFLAFISGAVVGGGLVLAKKKTLKSQVPFGPFLCGATIVTMLAGERILEWYLGLLG